MLRSKSIKLAKWQRVALWVALIVLSFLALKRLLRKPINNITNRLNMMNLHPVFKEVAQSLIDYATKKGYTVQVTSEYRTPKRQAELHKEDSRNPLLSYHNFGLAFDMVMTENKTGKKYLKNTQALDWLNTSIPQFAESLGLRWGGKFQGYFDPVHFDMGNKYSMDMLKMTIASQQGGNMDTWNGLNVKLS